MNLLPINKQHKAINAAAVITNGIGTTECSLNKLTITEARAPNPICKAPIKADALPAFLVNGASDKAAAFGLIKPKQARNKAIKPIVEYKFNQLFKANTKNIKLKIHCAISA